MESSAIGWEDILIPIGIYIIGQWFVYEILKRRFEQDRLLFSGVVSKRIEIYQKLLEQIFELKTAMVNFVHNSELKKEMHQSFINLRTTYMIHDPFLSKKILQLFIDFYSEVASISIDIGNYHRTSPRAEYIPDDKWNAIIDKYYSADERLTDSTLSRLEGGIIDALRKELGTDKA